MTIVIAGGSGFIGTALTKALLDRGHTVIVVDTHGPLQTHEKLFFIQCNLATTALPYNVLERTDVLINLAGAPISKRWTPRYKSEIRTSRIRSTRTLVDAIASAQTRPTVFISASAIGYYGETGEEVSDERRGRGEGFLAEVTAEWEGEARRAEEYGVRTVLIRTAPVLGQAGIIAAITKTARFGFLLRLTKKNYWFSWVHAEDIVAIYLFALETTTIQGPLNAVAPVSIRHHDFVKMLSKTIHRPVFGSLPRFLTRYLFGDLFFEITKDTRVIPQRLIDKGFTFSFPDMESALHALFSRARPRSKKKHT